MSEKDYTADCDTWSLGSEDRRRIVNVVTNVIADHIALARQEPAEETVAFIASHPETDEPSILIGFGESGPDDVYVPISEAMYDADPALLQQVTALLRTYCDR